MATIEALELNRDTDQNQKTIAYCSIKRMLDIIAAMVLIVFFGPLMLLIAAGIRISSPGPVFYRQIRIGKDGKQFAMLKFRSMQVKNNPDLHREYVQRLIRENTAPSSVDAPSLKLVRDPRITGVGKYLRKFGIDELPQLFNVLRGEMSIVGPRPSLPYEYELYTDWHKQRLAVLPGITGLWQVTAHNTVSFDEMVQIDLDYIRAITLWQDIKIMILTPVEMLKGKGFG